jgi:hypothetical protein
MFLVYLSFNDFDEKIKITKNYIHRLGKIYIKRYELRFYNDEPDGSLPTCTFE